MKVLFLDIDGVLNAHDATSIRDERSMHADKIQMINKIHQDTGCAIIIISNWAQSIGMEQLTAIMCQRGLIPGIVIDSIVPIPLDDTGLVTGIEKDSFVKKYVFDHAIEKYAIIDDNFPNAHEFILKLVSPNTYVGLTMPEALQVITILNG